MTSLLYFWMHPHLSYSNPLKEYSMLDLCGLIASIGISDDIVPKTTKHSDLNHE